MFTMFRVVVLQHQLKLVSLVWELVTD